MLTQKSDSHLPYARNLCLLEKKLEDTTSHLAEVEQAISLSASSVNNPVVKFFTVAIYNGFHSERWI